MTEEEHRVYTATLIMVERYRSWMNRANIHPEQSEDGTGINHAHYLLNIMHYNLTRGGEDFDLWKANRWLGFIQHEIILGGWTTVEEERNYSRPFFNKHTKQSLFPMNNKAESI